MDPTYIVNFENGRGLKLVAISTDNSIAKGHIAHYANSIHPAHKFPHKNAKHVNVLFDVNIKISFTYVKIYNYTLNI